MQIGYEGLQKSMPEWMDQSMNRSCGKRPGKNQVLIENSYAFVRFTKIAWDRHQIWGQKTPKLGTVLGFCYFWNLQGCLGMARGKTNFAWEWRFFHKFRMSRKAFLLLLEPPGLLLELRGNSPSGNESIVRNLGHLPSGGDRRRFQMSRAARDASVPGPRKTQQ